jgi:hypothetical protein
LAKVAELVIVNSKLSAVGCNIIGYFFRDDCIQEAMLDIMDAMAEGEIQEIAQFSFEGELWRDRVEAVMIVAQKQKGLGTPVTILFEDMQEVLDKVGCPLKTETDTDRVARMIGSITASMSDRKPILVVRGGILVPLDTL